MRIADLLIVDCRLLVVAIRNPQSSQSAFRNPANPQSAIHNLAIPQSAIRNQQFR
jgi:hypothetical protein